MNCGRFRGDGKEYDITCVEKPTPWINYLSNGRYFATILALLVAAREGPIP